MKTIDALTPAQRARMPAWRDRWIKAGLSTKPVNRRVAEKALRDCHRLGNPGSLRESVVEIQWVRSPTEMAAALLDGKRRAFTNAIEFGGEDPLNEAIRRAVKPVVLRAVWEGITFPVRDAINEVLGPAYLGRRGPPIDWVAQESFFRKVCGLELSEDLLERATAYAALASSVGLYLAHRKSAILCERPAAIRLEDGCLHAKGCLAVEWQDGTGIAAWRGTIILPEWVTVPGALTSEVALSHPNIKQRRCAAELLAVGDNREAN